MRSVGHLGWTKVGSRPCLATESLMAARSTMAGIPLPRRRRGGGPIHFENAKVSKDTQESRKKEAVTLLVMVEVDMCQMKSLRMRHSREVLQENSGR